MYPKACGKFTDHKAVRLMFIPNSLAPRTKFRIPEWLIAREDFIEEVLEKWKEKERSITRKPKAVLRLCSFKQVAIGVAKD